MHQKLSMRKVKFLVQIKSTCQIFCYHEGDKNVLPLRNTCSERYEKIQENVNKTKQILSYKHNFETKYFVICTINVIFQNVQMFIY